MTDNIQQTQSSNIIKIVIGIIIVLIVIILLSHIYCFIRMTDSSFVMREVIDGIYNDSALGGAVNLNALVHCAKDGFKCIIGYNDELLYGVPYNHLFGGKLSIDYINGLEKSVQYKIFSDTLCIEHVLNGTLVKKYICTRVEDTKTVKNQREKMKFLYFKNNP